MPNRYSNRAGFLLRALSLYEKGEWDDFGDEIVIGSQWAEDYSELGFSAEDGEVLRELSAELTRERGREASQRRTSPRAASSQHSRNTAKILIVYGNKMSSAGRTRLLQLLKEPVSDESAQQD
ncbi:MAG: hypothetical protein ACRD2R_08500, partial [Terriglobales bacterium]